MLKVVPKALQFREGVKNFYGTCSLSGGGVDPPPAKRFLFRQNIKKYSHAPKKPFFIKTISMCSKEIFIKSENFFNFFLSPKKSIYFIDALPDAAPVILLPF